ncbi:uncharacterized protein [Procambarus clarkii]|uniref:uncharacterized protein n=1 Tax=Procambarus clarkii TaxID=6728 RepID=UPI0037445EFE
MMDNKPEECSVCYNDYDDNQLRPRNLPCGHTFCSQCIDNAIKNSQLSCPSCRAEHAATAATQFPICYAVEAFVRKLKNIQLTTEEVVQAKPYEGPARGISKKLRSLVQEQKSIISSLITSCEEVLSQLGEYQGQLGDWKTHHLQLQDRLYALVEQNKSAMKLLELEDTSVVDMTTQGEKGKTRLQAMLGNLDTVNTLLVVDTTIGTADECSMKIEDWLQKCQELFPNVKTVHTSVKERSVGEWVAGGDYESNDGKGGARLLPDLQGQYRRSGRAGAVSCWWVSESPTSAQFIITTRDDQVYQWPNVFGDVVSGLDVIPKSQRLTFTEKLPVIYADCEKRTLANDQKSGTGSLENYSSSVEGEGIVVQNNSNIAEPGNINNESNIGKECINEGVEMKDGDGSKKDAAMTGTDATVEEFTEQIHKLENILDNLTNPVPDIMFPWRLQSTQFKMENSKQ